MVNRSTWCWSVLQNKHINLSPIVYRSLTLIPSYILNPNFVLNPNPIFDIKPSTLVQVLPSSLIQSLALNPN